ncbi:phosphomethylpyrimidine kinase [Parvularcula bermudensis HTCC2503]|uniref:hydroxymethylpyrimidine kinase n=1 Tax=Parvularcula bermudensis (strain ATCC BAA-594 / HTCC2503 / KCTC 12087) TaxID=314260 RepID=E0TIE0_PARBH|nr:bifunctional hydroxymethylpyrimidine kinase/phosphomethylpyrimidine kinase [Parvularcula bermudensis]ADM09724.1 phosphomethylpyrimidine kinase [Parvularcula bermudensis HTCC2503]
MLIIAGSDSGGGAGIQADIKSVTALGAYAMTAVTAITVQNTKGVEAVFPVPPDIVRQQIGAVLSDLGADAIKIGMIGSVATAKAILEGLEVAGAQDIPLILDPVLVATSGSRLGDDEVAQMIVEQFAAWTDILTPNRHELAVLTGRAVATPAEAAAAAGALLSRGFGAVLAKGGHFDGPRIVDQLIIGEGGLSRRFETPRFDSRHTHGTGCSLASALAARIAQGATWTDAVADAIAYVQAAIETAPGYGGGHGPLNHALRRGADGGFEPY